MKDWIASSLRSSQYRRSKFRYRPAIPRRMCPGFGGRPALLNNRGRGECRVPAAPAASCASVESTRVVTTVAPEHPAFPHAMVLTVSFVLSPVIGLVCHRRLRIWPVNTPAGRHASADLTPASRRQDHTTSPSAATSLVSAPLIAHRPIDLPCDPVARPT